MPSAAESVQVWFFHRPSNIRAASELYDHARADWDVEFVARDRRYPHRDRLVHCTFCGFTRQNLFKIFISIYFWPWKARPWLLYFRCYFKFSWRKNSCFFKAEPKSIAWSGREQITSKFIHKPHDTCSNLDDTQMCPSSPSKNRVRRVLGRTRI